MALTGSSDPERMVEEFEGTDRFVADYLIAEVMEQRSADERRFLIETSILRVLSPELCEAVTGRHDSALQLEQLEKANAFVISLDRSGRWYRYHPCGYRR